MPTCGGSAARAAPSPAGARGALRSRSRSEGPWLVLRKGKRASGRRRRLRAGATAAAATAATRRVSLARRGGAGAPPVRGELAPLLAAVDLEPAHRFLEVALRRHHAPGGGRPLRLAQ